MNIKELKTKYYLKQQDLWKSFDGQLNGDITIYDRETKNQVGIMDDLVKLFLDDKDLDFERFIKWNQ